MTKPLIRVETRAVLLFLKNYVLLFFPVLLFTYLGILSKWVDQYSEVTLRDLLLPGILGLFTSLGFSLIFYLPYRRNRFAGLLSALSMVLFTDPNYILRLDSALPFLRAINPFSLQGGDTPAFYNEFFLLVLIGLAFVIFSTIHTLTRKIEKYIPRLFQVGVIVVSVAFLAVFVPFVEITSQSWQQHFYRPPALPQTFTTPHERPDIYYIVLEDYMNQKVLKEQLNFDNSDFEQFLRGHGFTVDSNAYAPFPSSAMSIASTLNLDYNTDLMKKFSTAPYQTNQPYHDTARYSALIKQLKGAGYRYDVLGSWYETTNIAPIAHSLYTNEGILRVFGKTIRVGSFARPFLGILKRGFSIGKWNLLTYTAIHPDATNEKLKKLDAYAKQNTGGRFVFAQFIVPHGPFTFNADGSTNPFPDSNNFGKMVSQKYTDQIAFINTQMKTVIKNIQEQSHGTAIIILLSDEGNDPLLLSRQIFDTDVRRKIAENQDMASWPLSELQMKFGNLAAYYIPKATTEDVAHLNSVNAFRVVLNRYFGTTYSYLPSCNFAFSKGSKYPYVFSDVSVRLGNTSENCTSFLPNKI